MDLQLVVETLDVGEEFGRRVVASELDRAGRHDAVKECGASQAR
jgi:hypothetical protein